MCIGAKLQSLPKFDIWHGFPSSGSGHDVFGFVDGHAGGTITIENFNSTDNLAFGGYGYSLASPPTETIVAGNDVMTLSDGTQITFIGFNHKIF